MARQEQDKLRRTRWLATTPTLSGLPPQALTTRWRSGTPSKPCWTLWMPHAPTSCATSGRNTPRARPSPRSGPVNRPGMPAFPSRPRPRLPPHPAGRCRSDVRRPARNRSVPGPTGQLPLNRRRPAACARPTPRRPSWPSHRDYPASWRPSRPRRRESHRRPVDRGLDRVRDLDLDLDRGLDRRLSHQPCLSPLRLLPGRKAGGAGAPGRAPLGRTYHSVRPPRSTSSPPRLQRDLRHPSAPTGERPAADGGDPPTAGTCEWPASPGWARRAD
ncbi:hypothetical protein Save01_07671 [Streptomyces avermitilis]